MDEIKQRLQEASQACITTYEAWRAKPDPATRETLQEAVHELRKVGARLEIELAVSDRKSHGNEPIPIPSHRASRRQGPEAEMAEDEGNRQGGQQQGGGNRPQGGRDRGDRQGGRPVQIRPREEAAAASDGNVAAAAGGDDAAAPASGKRPLSLRRTGGDAEQNG